MALRRNVEKFVGAATGPKNVGTFLSKLVEGRFDNIPIFNTTPSNSTA